MQGHFVSSFPGILAESQRGFWALKKQRKTKWQVESSSLTAHNFGSYQFSNLVET
jgi:hypothetical protein